ncbi:collagen alpha-1(I) chain-like [Mustela nigripes]|uniref:collagen alpha-1(I) chain-like n=1 Tax=Mustela nigripes TaxID=77151 RepID=UPI002815BF05|nr:collagen alpha-1(I) chain-like [Mustela nigripes]
MQVEERPLHAPVPQSQRRPNREGQGQGTEAQQAEPRLRGPTAAKGEPEHEGPAPAASGRATALHRGRGVRPQRPWHPRPLGSVCPLCQRAEPSHPHTKPRFKPAYQQLLPRRPARSPPPPCPPRRRPGRSPVRVGREDPNTLRHGSGRPSVPRRGHLGRARSQLGGESPAPARRRVFRPGCGLVRGKGHGRRGRGDPRVRTSPPRTRPAVRASFSTGARARCPRARKAAGHPRPELSLARGRGVSPQQRARRERTQGSGGRRRGPATCTPRAHAECPKVERVPPGTLRGRGRSTKPASRTLSAPASPTAASASLLHPHRVRLPARDPPRRPRAPGQPAPSPVPAHGEPGRASGTTSTPGRPGFCSGRRAGPWGVNPAASPAADPEPEAPRPAAPRPPRRPGTAPPAPTAPTPTPPGANKAGVAPRQVSLRGRVAGTRRRLAGQSRRARAPSAAPVPPPPAPAPRPDTRPKLPQRAGERVRSRAPARPALAGLRVLQAATPPPSTGLRRLGAGGRPRARASPCNLPAGAPRPPARRPSRAPRPDWAPARRGPAPRGRSLPPAPPQSAALRVLGARRLRPRSESCRTSARTPHPRPRPARLPRCPPRRLPRGRSAHWRGGAACAGLGRGRRDAGRPLSAGGSACGGAGPPLAGRAAGADGLQGAGGRGRRGLGAAGNAGEPAGAAEAFPDPRRDGSETTPPPRLAPPPLSLDSPGHPPGCALPVRADPAPPSDTRPAATGTCPSEPRTARGACGRHRQRPPRAGGPWCEHREGASPKRGVLDVYPRRPGRRLRGFRPGLNIDGQGTAACEAGGGEGPRCAAGPAVGQADPPRPDGPLHARDAPRITAAEGARAVRRAEARPQRREQSKVSAEKGPGVHAVGVHAPGPFFPPHFTVGRMRRYRDPPPPPC